MSFVSLYLYVPDEGSLLPKYRDCTTSNDFEYMYIHIYVYIHINTIYLNKGIVSDFNGLFHNIGGMQCMT